MISLCMIVKNSEKMLDSCLKDMHELVDEIIILDTGSTDRTKEIARKYNAVIYDFKWTDNFSEARNYAYSKAKCDWILNLDDDEIISRRDFGRIKEIVNNSKFLGFYFTRRNYTNEIGAMGWISSKDDKYEESKIAYGFTQEKIARLFRNKPEIKSEGAIHDSIINSLLKIGKIGEADIPIHHFGFINRDREKTRRYIEIEKKNIKNDFYQEFQIAVQLHSIGELKDALNHLMASLQLNQEFSQSWLETAIIFMKLGKISEAKPLILKSLELKDNESAWNCLGIIEIHENNHEKALECFEKAIKLNPKNADFSFNYGNALIQSGNKEKGNEMLKKAADLNPAYKI